MLFRSNNFFFNLYKKYINFIEIKEISTPHQKNILLEEKLYFKNFHWVMPSLDKNQPQICHKTFAETLLKWKIKKNKSKSSNVSYTSFLIKKRNNFYLKKLKEEFLELIKELLSGNKKKIVHETADLIYHLLVSLEKKKVKFSYVVKELEKRQNISGIEEKKNRKKYVQHK